ELVLAAERLGGVEDHVDLVGAQPVHRLDDVVADAEERDLVAAPPEGVADLVLHVSLERRVGQVLGALPVMVLGTVPPIGGVEDDGDDHSVRDPEYPGSGAPRFFSTFRPAGAGGGSGARPRGGGPARPADDAEVAELLAEDRPLVLGP